MTQHGLKDASSDKAQIEHWWKTAPAANIAIRCGLVSAGLVVIDVDGEEGIASIKGKQLPPTVMARTGGGGFHYFYWFKGRLRPKVGLLPKVDLRAEDSYVVAPPSIHPSGTSYEWVTSPTDTVIAMLPEWVSKMAESPAVAVPQPAQEGKGDKTRLGRAALEFVATGAPPGEQRAKAVAAARNFLSAGYSAQATAHKIWEGFRHCEQNADEPWAFKHALDIAQDLASKPAPPMRPLDKPQTQTAHNETTTPVTPPKPTPNGKRSRPEIVNAIDLMKKQFPPLTYLVPGILPHGLTLLAAKPKIGKTWLSLDLALGIAYGGRVLNSIRVDGGNVLYMALEDGERRIQSRLRILIDDQSPPPALDFAYNWLRMNEGGIEMLEDWLKEHPQARLVVVDTIKRVRPRERVGANSYNQDYEAIAPLADLSHKYDISIICVHHTRKQESEDAMETVSGTLGLPGAADHVLVLKRARGEGQGTLALMGRDVEDKELALLWEAPRWRLLGDAKQFQMSAERKEIVDLVRKAGRAMSPKEVSDMLQKPPSSVRRLMSLLNMDGVLLANSKGHYDIPPLEKYGLGEHPERGEQAERGEQGERWWNVDGERSGARGARLDSENGTEHANGQGDGGDWATV